MKVAGAGLGYVGMVTAACLTGGAMPIPLESLLATTKATIAVGESLSSGCREFV